MSKTSLTMAAAILCLSLTACGGGGGSGGSLAAANDPGGSTTAGQNSSPGTDTGGTADNSSGSTTTPPSGGTTGTGTNTNTGTATDTGGGTNPPGASTTSPPPGDTSGTGSDSGGAGSAPFAALVTIAPPSGSTQAGTVQLEVRGSAIENAELLPAEGYSPLLGRFTVSADKSMASLAFNTGGLPNGILLARISAYDRPAGIGGATEIIAMPARRWTLANSPEPVVTEIPPASLMPEVHISNLALPYVDPAPLAAMMQLDDAAYDAMLQNEWARVEAEMLRYIPAHVVLYPPTPNGFSGPWYSCLGQHTRLACREAMNGMIGLMRGKAG